MQSVKKLYRSNYQGEQIVKDLTYRDGKWERKTEYVPNNVINNQTSNIAVIIGNGPSRDGLYPQGNIFLFLDTHKGGLFGSNALQTYGCNALHRDYVPTFLVANGPEITKEIADSGFCDDNIVYSNANAVLDYPGKFYLTPQNPSWDAGAIATYIAAFDGHKKIYLLGFDCYTDQANENYNVYANTPGYPAHTDPTTEQFFIKSLLQVMTTYNDIEFIRVMPTESWYCPEEWKYLLNFRQIAFREFVLEIDLG